MKIRLVIFVLLPLTVFLTWTAVSARKNDNLQQGSYVSYLPVLYNETYTLEPADEGWPMAGANLERNSWTPEEIRGKLKPVWYRPVEPYITPKVQVIAAYDLLFVSTSGGLYALDAETGAEKWVFPTQMPLGHSPTAANGIIYVGGFDHHLYALDALTGKQLWAFEASAGFDTNPLVAGGIVYAGNRDGFFYAIYAGGPQAGKLAWKFATSGPIHYSAAYKQGAVFFASDDSHAYALSALSGELIWKSAKLPGEGFHSWWPVIYEDWVIFAGSNRYRFEVEPGIGFLHNIEKDDIYLTNKTDPPYTYVGPVGKASGRWVAGTPTIDTSQPNLSGTVRTTAVSEYFEQKPWRRTYFVLNLQTGEEYTSDFDRDGRAEYAPILWFSSDGAGTRYPPMIAGDGVLYQPNNYISNPSIARGFLTGWDVGTPNISLIADGWNAVDEPIAYSGGGNLIYWNRCCDRIAGAIDISKPVTAGDRTWQYYEYDLPELIPGYNIMTHVWDPYFKPFGGVYGGRNGSYGWHGDGSPPVPYKGKLYMILSNAIVAFSPQAESPQALPLLEQVEPTQPPDLTVDEARLKELLAAEVQKMIAAGHLRPGYSSTGHYDFLARSHCGESLSDYWHHPGDVVYTLIRALPYLPANLQTATREYIQAEFKAYPPYEYNHTGWSDGASREVFDLPPEVEAERKEFAPEVKTRIEFRGWTFAPHQFYALWKYADTFGGAPTIFAASKARLEPVPANEILLEMPHVHNAFIAGYWGYLELEKLAGFPETASVRSELERLLQLRVSTFSKNAPESYFTDDRQFYCRALNVSRNFIYLVPELGQYLHEHALSKVQEAVEEYERVAPLWFVSKAETAFGEDVINQLYDYNALFQAKALILDAPQSELARYVDVPAFAVGDLFYIQNLASALEAGAQAAGVSQAAETQLAGQAQAGKPDACIPQH